MVVVVVGDQGELPVCVDVDVKFVVPFPAVELTFSLPPSIFDNFEMRLFNIPPTDWSPVSSLFSLAKRSEGAT